MTNSKPLVKIAKRLRGEMTDAERVLWREVRAHRFAGYKFKRQEPLDSYVVDFICYEAKLIIEIDGGQHADKRGADEVRTRWLESQGYCVLRFWNNDVLNNIEGVMQEIEKYLNSEPTPSPYPLPQGEREKKTKGIS
jgi:very-short-patch-repair endonuclease